MREIMMASVYSSIVSGAISRRKLLKTAERSAKSDMRCRVLVFVILFILPRSRFLPFFLHFRTQLAIIRLPALAFKVLGLP